MEENSLPAFLSINQLCSLMKISRSRYYQLLSEGIILSPIHTPNSKRPYFTKEMAIKNLEVKKNNIGVNNKICIFYNSNSSFSSAKNNSPKKENKKNTTNKYDDLSEGLSCLGIDDIKVSQIEIIVKKLFPSGTENVEDGEILKAVYCQIKEQNSNDNQDR